MNIVNNLKNFLYDQNYFISIYEDHIHLYGYEKIKKFEIDEIIIDFKNFELNIKGTNLKFLKMNLNESLVSGEITKLEMEKNEISMG